MFAEEDGATINNEDRKEFQAFQPGDFLNLSLRFWGFGANFLIKKRVSLCNMSPSCQLQLKHP